MRRTNMARSKAHRVGVVGFRSIVGSVILMALVLPGSAFGGSFSVLLESNSDNSGGSEVYVVGFHSLADLYSNTPTGSGYTAMNVNSAFSVGGFAFDGDQYHIVLESDADAAGGSEVYLISYDSLADVYSNSQAGSGYTAMNINDAFSVGGFAGEMPLVVDGFESGDTSGWSSFGGGFHDLTLLSGQGYDFSEWTSGATNHGDFYFLYQSGESTFWANNFGMRGLVDLGVTPGNLADISVPTSGYYSYGVEAILHHTYVSLAAVGEDGYYIIFRVTAVSSAATTIEGIYVYRP